MRKQTIIHENLKKLINEIDELEENVTDEQPIWIRQEYWRISSENFKEIFYQLV